MKTIKELHDEDQFEAMRHKCLTIVKNRINEIKKEESLPWYKKLMRLLIHTCQT